MIVGFSIWMYTLLLPTLFADTNVYSSIVRDGLFGIEWLRPYALFGVTRLDPIVHSVFWTMLLNASAFIIASICSFPNPVERLQATTFVNVFDLAEETGGWRGAAIEAEDLLVMAQRIIGGVMHNGSLRKWRESRVKKDICPTSRQTSSLYLNAVWRARSVRRRPTR